MWTLALGVGASEVWSTLASKLIVDELAHGRWLLAVLWGLSAGLAFVLGLLSDMTALQRFEATRVGPIVLVAQVVIPVLLAPLLAGEAWGSTSLSRAAFLVSLAAVTAGTALLGSSRAVAELVDPLDIVLHAGFARYRQDVEYGRVPGQGQGQRLEAWIGRECPGSAAA